jgi:hypothetical protein
MEDGKEVTMVITKMSTAAKIREGRNELLDILADLLHNKLWPIVTGDYSFYSDFSQDGDEYVAKVYVGQRSVTL